MSNKDTKSFKVPKIRREDSKDNLRQVDITSRDCIEIVNTVKRSYLDSSFESAWQLKTAALVENRELEAKYRAKKAELKEEGRNARELTEHFAFMIQRDNTIVPYVVKDGLKCKSVYQSLLGDSKLGVYIWRNADIQLRLAESWKVPSCTLLVFKIVLGKCKVLAQQHTEENTEPTPNFDSHVPQSQPRLSDNFNVQLARSQIYLYEYTEDCEPSTRPRQCLPYAILTYEKTDNVPRSLTGKIDSYSKRPKSASWATDVDATKQNTSQNPLSKRDPRLGQVDASLNLGSGAEAGLCVPRLTPGPPAKDLNAACSDPDDPRSQLSFLASSSKQTFKEFTYQPSFGPDADELTEFEQEIDKKQEPLSSLPPIKLPLLPDPLIPPNSELDTRYTDPRFGYVDSSGSTVPSDPRFRPKDPRLQSTPSDPRLQQMQLDPRRQQGPLDPRVLQLASDPRFKSADPRVQQSSSNQQDVNSLVQKRFIKAQVDDTSKIRKKLSLSDYKKKISVQENNEELAAALNFESKQGQKVPVVSDVSKQVVYQSVASVQVNSQSFAEKRDPRLNYQSDKAGSPLQTYVTSISEQRDPRLIYHSNQNTSEAKSFSGSMSEQRDPRLFQLSSANTMQFNKQSPEEWICLPASEIRDASNENYAEDVEDDIVKETDDMAKTLNELSDPDDISQSPKEFEEAVPEEPKIEDPMLAAAMQKLVEHSGNVTLFTEALRMLQESAEEFGEQLTDPEFLVKKIAEKIEELSKLEAEKLAKPQPKEIQEINSPELIMSPDLSNDAKSDLSAPVKHIPLESVDMDIEKPDPKPESKLDLAMQKTLEELEKIEKSQSKTTQKVRNSSNKSKNKKGKREGSLDNDLLDIPIPPEPPKQTNSELPAASQGLKFESPRKLEIEKKCVNENKDREDDDEDMKITQILPSLKEQKETKKKPVISFHFRRKIKPSDTVPDHFKDDIDLRVNSEKAGVIKKKVKQNPDLLDKDFRKETVQNEGTQPSKVSEHRNKNDENETKTLDMFELNSVSDLYERKCVKNDVVNKGFEMQSIGQKNSSTKFVDPFGLEHDGLDDRTSTSVAQSNQKKDLNDFGDIDWRHASGPVVDVDLRPRSTDTSTENSQCSELGDFDLRRSHSRSVSPSPGNLSSKKDSITSLQQPVRKFVDPFGLDEDTDDRLISKRNSPILLKESDKQSRNTEIAVAPSQDSNSGSGILFDAYSLGKSNLEGVIHASNEYGDIDWRQAAAAEMGDVDLRSVPVENPALNRVQNQATTISATIDSVSNTQTSVHVADPFQQMNKNLQTMFNTSQGISQYQTSVLSNDSYTASHLNYPYESYTTSKTTYSDSFNTNINAEKTDSVKYGSSGSEQFTQNQDGIQNIMKTLDFSNLKNILATVQTPAEALPKDAVETVSDIERESSEKQVLDKPAFLLDLASVKKKGDELRKSDSPTYTQHSSPKKNLNKNDTNTENKESEKTLFRIPGFDISPEKEINKSLDSVKDDGNLNDTEETKSVSASDELEQQDSRLELNERSNSKVNESLLSTPKDKTRKEDELFMTPLPDISYQAAILESIEKSALKIRHDDSSEMEESPVRKPKKEKSKHRKTPTETNDQKSESTKRKQEQDSGDEKSTHKVLKKENDKDENVFEIDEDDEDEEASLIIDLSPGAKTVDEKVNSPETNVEERAHTIDLTDDAEPVLVIDDEEDKKRSDSDDLHAEDTLQAKSADEMTDMIEKSRKSMVIKLKGQTKLVNPKTGKAYDKAPQGSAIEVLGQMCGSKEVTAQQIHPVHGVVPVQSPQSSTASLWKNSKQASSVSGQNIPTIAGVDSEKLSQSSKACITTSVHVNSVPETEKYDSVSKGSSSTMFHSTSVTTPLQIQSVSVAERLVQVAPVPTIANVVNTTISSVPLVSHINPAQQPSNSLAYIHPVTGQSISYGQAPVVPAFGNVSVPVATVAMPEPQPVPQPLPQLVPLQVLPAVPQPAVLPPVAQPVVIVPGQSQTVPRLPFLPAGLGQQGQRLTVQPFGTSQTPQPQPSDQVHVSSGQAVKPQNETAARAQGCKESKSADVFDCFRDKFEKRDVSNQQKIDGKKNVNDSSTSDSKNAYSVKLFLEDIEMKARKELNAQLSFKTTTIKTEQVEKKEIVKVETESSGNVSPRKRPGEGDGRGTTVKRIKNEVDDGKGSTVKRMKNEFESKLKPQNDFGSKVLESLTEVKSKLTSPEKSSPKKISPSPEKHNTTIEIKVEDKIIKKEPKKETPDSGASSELEDGEISEDSLSESEEPFNNVSGPNIQGSSIPVLGSRPTHFNRIPTIGSWNQNSSNRSMNIGGFAQRGSFAPRRQNTAFNAYSVGADWSDILQNPETRAIERIKATNTESPSLHSAGASLDDAASIVSKSAASISRSRQKNKAQSQVKTLGEWLKLELEIDNIAPLQNIIPYALNTDLTKIPKQRKRRIRMKVKNAIEQEGSKAINFERKETVTVEVFLPEKQEPKPLNPDYLPEVSNEQTERELQMLGTSLNFLRHRINQKTTLSNFGGNSFQDRGQFGQFSSLGEAAEDKKMIVAMTLVESEMKVHLSRTCFYGYPHRRVPDELLLDSELGGFKTESDEVFLILMMPLSAKPYNKLLQLRNSLQDLYDRRKCTTNPTSLVKIEEEITQSHNQRQAALRGFTGYLNKKRIQKLQETVDKYTLVYDYFKMKTPPAPDSMLKFIRTTQMDLRQHLILARQYLALEEQKMH